MNDEQLGFETRCLHVGQGPDPATGAAAPPIYQTSSYEFPDADTAAARYALEDEGNVYSRIANPTVRALEERLASLEGGVDALATASGMGALDAATLVLAEAGDNIVCASSVYGGTHAYLTHTAARRGIEARFVDTLEPDAYAEAIDEDTAYVHCETIANPALVTPPFEEIADVAHEASTPLFVDNTFGTPALCRPLEHGADLVWDSTTKWIHGSGTTLGGVLVTDGSFPFSESPEKYPEIAAPNPAFDGVTFTERFGDRALTMAARQRGARSLGDQQSPFDAWVTMQGVETLPLRMERHCENAMTVAEYLNEHPAVSWVSYPGLPEHETHELASEYLEGGYGGMIAVGLESGYDAAKQLCEDTELATFLANIGDARTLVVHPASTTHAQLSEAEQRAAGVAPEMVRLSVGIEDVDDILADLDGVL
ncbi:MAG: O-acetylhomoserine (thiol)-lyase [Natronomonas sp.]|jgi:O-acetylhomoserine (thiol)-lyase|uniref:O-acetylhomoserine aminocarboxypropyltransferase/cysteine synthase family protein n=1 Tax=Natronomonas sp. TaxID=2184060 RepID=UPI003989390A